MDVLEEQTTEQGLYRVRVEVDQDASMCDPRDNDNLGVIVALRHRQYIWPQEDGAAVNAPTVVDAILDRGFQTVSRWLRVAHGVPVVLPLHIGGGNRDVLSVGRADEVIGAEDYAGVIYARESEGMTSEHVEQVLRAELTEYASWCEGEVYGYVVERSTDDDGEVWGEVTSCWGHIGQEWAEQAAREALAEAVSSETVEHAEVSGDADVEYAAAVMGVGAP